MMKPQYEYKNKAISKAGCFFLSHIHFFETEDKPIGEETVERIYRDLVEQKLMKKNCFILGDKKALLVRISKILERPMMKCHYIGKWHLGKVQFFNEDSKRYYELFKMYKGNQYCIDEYADYKGQHFLRVNAKGETIYNPYPNSSTQRFGQKVSTRLYYIEFWD